MYTNLFVCDFAFFKENNSKILFGFKNCLFILNFESVNSCASRKSAILIKKMDNHEELLEKFQVCRTQNFVV